LWVCLALASIPVWSQTLASGIVTYVADGDTVYVRLSEHTAAVPVRLFGIDAPEICQAGGQAARQALQALLQDQAVTVLRQQTDGYGRELATVYWQGQDVARAMVERGMAWSYRFGRDPGPYVREQQIARAAGLGLFAQPSPEPPHRFRQRHGSCKLAP
jgi:endonuclease YncB( thermonuclease family)